jgi:hypothetical protein
MNGCANKPIASFLSALFYNIILEYEEKEKRWNGRKIEKEEEEERFVDLDKAFRNPIVEVVRPH